MATQILTEVTFRQKLCEFVESFYHAHSAKLIERLAPVLKPALEEGQNLPDVLGVLNVLMARLSWSLKVLMETEQVHLNETGNDPDVREARVAITGVVREVMIDTRDLCRLAFGRSKAEAIGYENRIAADPVALARQGSRVVVNLQNPDLVLPTARYELSVTPESMLSTLEQPIARLIALNDAITHERTGFQGTLVAKEDAKKDFDRTYGQTVQVLRGLFRMAGMPELARRMSRTVPRRPIRGEDVPADPVTETASPDAVPDSASDTVPDSETASAPDSETDSTHDS